MAARKLRAALGVRPSIKQIDTLAGEFTARANYLYMTYGNSEEENAESDVSLGENVALVLGSGVYRIGASVEFDYGCVAAARALREIGRRTCIVNCNPETVSTDYEESDALLFEPLTKERVLDIAQGEQVSGVIVSFAGQIGNDLASSLEAAGVKVLGTAPRDIDTAEDRHAFGALLDSANIDQPTWCETRSEEG